MNQSDIDYRLRELKSDYARLQGDLEKVESVGGNTSGIENMLQNIEKEMKELRQLKAQK